MRRALLILSASVGLMAAEPAPAPDRPLPDAVQEARARALFRDIRCVVCQHEAIADSPAGVAADMRRLVREEVAAGRTDVEIREGLVARYGDYVLFRPPFGPGTLLLWLGPAALLLLGLGIVLMRSRRRAVEPSPLSPDEERRLAEFLQTETVRPTVDASAPHDGR